MTSKQFLLLAVTSLSLVACANTSTPTTTESSPSQSQEATTNLSNSDKAIAVIKSFETGDQTAISNYVSPDTYIQHNLSVPDGRDVVLAAIGQLAEAGTSVEILRQFEDGDYVVLHSKYQIAGGEEQAGFDVFRFENGLIVEHWDNLQTLAEANPSGHTLLDGATELTDLEQTADNKVLVENFVTDILVNRDLDRAAAYFDGDNYIQHNPATADGATATIEGFQGIIDSGFDMTYTDIKFVLGQGNFVLVASQGTLMGEEAAYYDLFRVENGFIAEHWDTVETIPDQDNWANSNGKF